MVHPWDEERKSRRKDRKQARREKTDGYEKLRREFAAFLTGSAGVTISAAKRIGRHGFYNCPQLPFLKHLSKKVAKKPGYRVSPPF